MKRWCIGLTVAVVLVGVGRTEAGIIPVTSRAALAGTDFIDWGVKGSPFTLLSNPFSITSNGGLNVNVAKPDGTQFIRFDQQSPVWNGNFAPGDHLLSTNHSGGGSDPIALTDFGGLGVTAAGAQIQVGAFGNFVAKIEAFDINGASLGSFQRTGDSNAQGDNSAIFIGISSNAATIHKMAFSLLAPAEQTTNFVINQVGFTPSTVPEPSTLTMIWSLLGALGITVGWPRQRKRA